MNKYFYRNNFANKKLSSSCNKKLCPYFFANLLLNFRDTQPYQMNKSFKHDLITNQKLNSNF